MIKNKNNKEKIIDKQFNSDEYDESDESEEFLDKHLTEFYENYRDHKISNNNK